MFATRIRTSAGPAATSLLLWILLLTGCGGGGNGGSAAAPTAAEPAPAAPTATAPAVTEPAVTEPAVTAPTAAPCLDPATEAALFNRESALLGSSHALEHAQVRATQCQVASTPGQGAGTSGPGTPVPVTPVPVTPVPVTPEDDGQGRWSDPFTIPVVGVTAVLLHTGKVLFWSYNPDEYLNPANSNQGVAYIWDPATRTGRSIAPPENIWCAGQTLLADGRVFLAGGNLRYPDPSAPPGSQSWKGTLTTYTFNPATETFVRQPDMRNGRWYPTTTQLADNRVVITSGWDEFGGETINSNVEVFTPSASPGGVGRIDHVGYHTASALYPLQFLLLGGSMLEAGPGTMSSYLFSPADYQWSRLPDLLGNHYANGNGIIYTDASGPTARQLVMVAGGQDQLKAPMTGNEWLDGNAPWGGWNAFPRWSQARHNSNTVILPDGKLLTMGGNSGRGQYDGPVFQVELYSTQATDTTGHWQTVVPHTIQAAYHSSAILLPDATVLLSQDDMGAASAQAAAAHQAQVYSPPYLFPGARPLIVSAPAGVTYGQSFAVTTDRQVTTAVLVAPGATTHGNDMHQRAIRLPVQQVNETTVRASVPNSAAMVPPGYYMLFVLDGSGIPSIAKFVLVG